MDNNPDIAKPGNLKSWADEHKEWFTGMYRAGIKKTREELEKKAGQIKGISGVSTEAVTALTNIADNGKIDDYCKDTFVWT